MIDKAVKSGRDRFLANGYIPILGSLGIDTKRGGAQFSEEDTIVLLNA